MEEPFPRGNMERERRELPYYQWVSFLLIAQVLLFLAPKAMWNAFNWKRGVSASALAALAMPTAALKSSSSSSGGGGGGGDDAEAERYAKAAALLRARVHFNNNHNKNNSHNNNNGSVVGSSLNKRRVELLMNGGSLPEKASSALSPRKSTHDNGGRPLSLKPQSFPIALINYLIDGN